MEAIVGVDIRNRQVKFVFKTDEAAEKALEEGATFRDRQIPVTRAYKACKTLVEVKVANMPISSPIKMTKELIKAFQPFGKVVDTCLYMVNSNHAMTEYTLVLINTAVDAEDTSRPRALKIDGRTNHITF
ncbi:hypothetical protein THASP1DRAFT_29452 [Thamnocephalis sphaerospora]|uniref:RRM domain-containing protein n=1 Tax=Thamnocephalis sphaerospora TaxID=78915 RepID=A0A4P9XRN8_9FUNG|nr:hypothetical protein THASP1DRAFT_29452 [Thamnocephalis sphaerospora]|eukprot:RKP08738.1 hypothetical protein THASP1DRAFT_29452 [Thamnocephalis sphaerospora]